MALLIDTRHQNDESPSEETEEGLAPLWDLIADDLVGLIAHCLTPTRPLVSGDKHVYAETSIGAAHWMQLSASVRARAS